jgi:hypothetical protein
MRFTLLLILSLLIGIVACKKKDDTQGPSMSIISPSDGSSFSVFDTILVELQVSDNEIVTSVSVTLLDNGVAVIPTVSRSINQANANVVLALPISNLYLETGQYSLRARATDGKNEENKFISVFVQEEAKRFRGLMAITENAGSVAVYRLDSVFNQSVLHVTAMDLSAASISSYAQQVYIAGGVSGDLLALDINDGSIRWDAPNLGIGTIPYFHFTHIASNILYASNDDGFIRGYNEFGGVVFNADVLSGYRAGYEWKQDNKLISEQKLITGNDRKLVIYFAGSGAIESEYLIDKSLIAAFQRQGSDALIFGNRNGDGVIQIFNTDFGPGFEPRTFNGEPLKVVDQLDANNYLIATSSGLYKYTYSNNNLQMISGNQSILDLQYDLLTGVLYAISGTDILAIDPNSGNSSTIGSLGAPIKRILPFYNK